MADIISANRHDIDSCNPLGGSDEPKWPEKDPTGLILVIADMARQIPVTSAFVAEMARQFTGDQSGALLFPLTWIEQRLSESNLNH